PLVSSRGQIWRGLHAAPQTLPWTRWPHIRFRRRPKPRRGGLAGAPLPPLPVPANLVSNESPAPHLPACFLHLLTLAFFRFQVVDQELDCLLCELAVDLVAYDDDRRQTARSQTRHDL